MLKRLMSLLLVLAMVLAMLPVSALAEETEPTETSVQDTVGETEAEETSIQEAPAESSTEMTELPEETTRAAEEATVAAEETDPTEETEEDCSVPTDEPAEETTESTEETMAELTEEAMLSEAEFLFAGGDGTEENPYQVATAAQLDAVRSNLTAFYVQTADIDLSGMEWLPIGYLDRETNGSKFTGVYDGGGFAICNMTITRGDVPAKQIGLFTSNSGTLKNIVLEDMNISFSAIDYCTVGGIVASSTGKLDSCTVSGQMTVSAINDFTIGGIAGTTYHALNCRNHADITVTMREEGRESDPKTQCGGIAGWACNSMTDCVNFGDMHVSAVDRAEVGGIVGHGEGGVYYGVNYGDVYAEVFRGNTSLFEAECFAGGIIGCAVAMANECINRGQNITATAAGIAHSAAGGIVGGMFDNVGSCQTNFNLAQNISAEDYVGRISGNPARYGDKYNCSIETTKINGQIPSATGSNTSHGRSMTEDEMFDAITGTLLRLNLCVDFTVEDALERLYIDQHIDYYHSSQYDEDILADYDKYMQAVADDMESDAGIYTYELLENVSNALELGFDLDDTELYELLLADLLSREQNSQAYQKIFEEELRLSAIEVFEDFLLKNAVKLEWDYAEKLKESFTALVEENRDMHKFSKCFETLMTDISREFSVEDFKNWAKNSDIELNIGFEVFNTTTESLAELVEYVCYSRAYAAASDEIRQILLDFWMLAQVNSGDWDHFCEQFGLISGIVNINSLCTALENFVTVIPEYAQKDSDTLTREVLKNGATNLAGSAVKGAAQAGLDTIIRYIPILNLLPVIREALSGGMTVVQLLSGVDDSAMAANMMARTCAMIYIMEQVVDNRGSVLVNTEQFKNAVLFDSAVGVYKSLRRIAADYAVNYMERKLDYYNRGVDNVNGIAWCGAAISMVKLEKLIIDQIRCHSSDLSYDPSTGTFTQYDQDALKIYGVACPVTVTVTSDTGKQMAVLSDSSSETAEGYGHYFFTVPIAGSEERIKVAIVPEDYEVVLTGTGIGSMNVYTADWNAGIIENAVGYYEIPVTEATVGTFAPIDENPERLELVVDGTSCVGDDTGHIHQYGDVWFAWNGDHSSCMVFLSCSTCGETFVQTCQVTETVFQATETEPEKTAYTAQIQWEGQTYSETAEVFSYVISFQTGSNPVADLKLREGSLIPEPAGLILEGYTICGWYTDKAFSEAWDFTGDTVSGNITLYAKWLPNEFDKEGSDTGICIEILNEDGYVYTGKAIKPQIIVRDDGRVLTEGKDYTVTYKNNTNARDKEDTSVKLSRLPQIIIQGKGNYKSARKIVKYFTIHQAEMKDLQITLPKFVICKTGNRNQTLKATVSTGLAKVAASAYTLHYYTDAELTAEVKGITGPGVYYVTLEAKLDKNGSYSGNFCGVSDVFIVEAAAKTQMLSSGKITVPKAVTAVDTQPDENTAIQALITKFTLNKVDYLTDEANIEMFKETFTVTAKDSDGTAVSQADLGTILMSVGKKTITISAREGNAYGLVGEKSASVTVRGTALKKTQFAVTFDKTGETNVIKSQYSGVSQVPCVFSELEEGRDYTVTYKSGKTVLSSLQVKNAGSYSVVITGKGSYSGTLTYSFSITKVDIAKAYAAGMLKITSPGKAVYSPAGAKLSLSVSYVNERGTRVAMAEGRDYTLSYSGNKAITDKAAMTLKGKGNFSGSLNKTKAPELIYSVTAKPIGASDVSVTINGVTVKTGQITSVKYTVYHAGKKVAANQYTGELTANDNDTVTLKIIAKEKLYTGSRSLVIRNDLIKATDTKKVKITLPRENRYYTGSSIRPEVTITDAEGNDISHCFTVTYGENTKVGTGSITITGRPDMGYYGAKTLKFTILPKWAKWIFG